MITIGSRNVEDALLKGMRLIELHGVKSESRNGPVRAFACPVTTIYNSPRERVIFLPERDANPFFHFMEGLWMLAGRNDVVWISQFNSRIGNYSDDGVTFHGAYGHRWRNHFVGADGDSIGVLDQLATIAELLHRNPDDRRIVLQMWDPMSDLGMEGKDFPCNTQILFRINPYGVLDMTVINRSNDMIWGAYGANAVHMSMLQEVLAAWVGVPVGRYWQMSTNLHVYEEVYQKHSALLTAATTDHYLLGKVMPFPMVTVNINQWFGELSMFMDQGPVIGFQDPFFKRVASPIYTAWFAWKDIDNPDRAHAALSILTGCAALDWRLACEEWIMRRIS